jgi:hypothetical protein
MGDDPKKPESPKSSIASFAEGHGWYLTPEEVQRQMMERMERILKAKREQIEWEKKAAEEFARELESALANAEADPSADIAEPVVDVQAPEPKAARQAKSAKSGRYDDSDRSHFSAMEKFIATGESVEAAARFLREKLEGVGTADNKAKRLAKLYRKERGKQS